MTYAKEFRQPYTRLINGTLLPSIQGIFRIFCCALVISFFELMMSAYFRDEEKRLRAEDLKRGLVSRCQINATKIMQRRDQKRNQGMKILLSHLWALYTHACPKLVPDVVSSINSTFFQGRPCRILGLKRHFRSCFLGKSTQVHCAACGWACIIKLQEQRILNAEHP